MHREHLVMILREIGNAEGGNGQIVKITRKEIESIDRDWGVKRGDARDKMEFPLLNCAEWALITE